MPYLPESEIFDEYVKIAQEQGFVSEADFGNYPEGRIDSNTVEDVALLYGIKPNGKDYDVLDLAHPDMFVAAPAYDRMNSIVENLKERHNMMCDIAMKTPTGNLTMHRYVHAHNDLLNALIRTGFTLDNNDQKDLMKLADSCAGRLKKKDNPVMGKKDNPVMGVATVALLEKRAWAFLVPWLVELGLSEGGAAAFTGSLPYIARGIAMGLGAIGFSNHMATNKQHIIGNCNLVLKGLVKLRGKFPKIEAMEQDVTELMQLADQFEPERSIEIKPEELATVSTKYAKEIEITKKFITKLRGVKSRIPGYIAELDASSREETSDWVQKLETVEHFILPSDEVKTQKDFEGLDKAIDDSMKQAEKFLTDAHQDIPLVEKQIATQITSQDPGVFGMVRSFFGV